MAEESKKGRRDWLASVAMGVGLVLSYGTLAAQGILFLLPRRLQPPTRSLFAGRTEHYPEGGVRTFTDLEGNEILIRREVEGFEAFSSTCPHLGCKVHWQPERDRFFCPCHNGVFNADGVAVSGPPADAGQSLHPVPLRVESGVVYVEVKEPKGRRA